MTTLTMTLTNAPHRQVIIRLGGVATGTVPVDDAHNVLTSWTTRTNASGVASIVLPATADITPSDTYYIVTVDQTSPTAIYYLELPDTTTVDLSDEANWIAVPEPPVLFPHPSTGNAGDVVKVNSARTRYELGAVSGGGGASTSDDLTVPAGTMSTTEAGFPPATDSLTDLLGSIDEGVDYTLGVLNSQGGEIGHVQRLRHVATSIGTVIDDTVAYLKVGHDGTGTPGHDEGAFVCDTDLEFPTAVDIRIRGRLVRTAGDDTFAELVGRNVDALVGAVDNYEAAVYQDADGKLRWFAEHIYTGQSVEQNPRCLTAADNDDNPVLGAPFLIRHTIEYTANAGNGRERFWIPTGTDAPGVVTADGIGWRLIHQVDHSHPESLKTATEPWHIGLSEHLSHIYAVQMYDGIDGTLLVDLHASDATSATSVTCREGTVWTAAGTQGEVVNYQTALPNNLPFHDIACWQWWHSASGTSPARAQNSARYGGGYLDAINSTSVTTTGHYVEWKFAADAGTWTISCINDKQSNSGTWTITVDGTDIETMGVADSELSLYNPTTATNVVTEFTGLVIPTNGTHTIRFTSTANGAGGNSGGRFTRLGFRRTA